MKGERFSCCVQFNSLPSDLYTYDEAMQQLPTNLSGQCGFHSSSKLLEVGRSNRVYDNRCARCFVLQELFDNFDHNSRLDILKSNEKTTENDSQLDKILRYLERNCGWFLESFLSCFAVQVSLTLLQLTYSWCQQLVLVLNDLFVGDIIVEQLTKRKEFTLGNLEVV